MKIVIVSDHAGFGMKEDLKNYLGEKGFELNDLGTFSEESCDYPDFAHPAAQAVEKGDADFGIAICGTGNGMQMTLNKHQGIRAALCWTPDIAALARQHNNANFLVLPARFIDDKEGKEIADAFFNASFEGGRHIKRVNKIPLDIPVEGEIL